MTTSTRLGVGPLRLLPQSVPVVLLLFAVVLAPVAPAGVTGTLHRVDTPLFSVVEGFDCASTDLLVTCTVPVAGRPLTVEADLAAGPTSGSCSATYDGRRLRCDRVTQYGPASPWVRVSSLDVPASEAPSTPWWRDALDLWWERALLLGGLVLALVAGSAAFALYRGPRLEDGDRLRRTVITGVSSWALAIVSTVLVSARVEATTLVVAVALLVPAGLMAFWQHVAAGPAGGRPRERLGQAAVAVLATAVLGVVHLLWLGLAAGLPD
ncbi:hypothetical protein LZG04_09770 [Saccharothrix sp. S26]|uniref:hypothetical protein n=1 Tax=Saccharothrix sp. S26 TaxID=2907215 RepID=UPI001F1DE208|nr:hypothetical protein [Saccharothrix sp. S26]MCE6995094.1 hypothetical protein [Saccharothrix sp. S26]